MRRLSRAVAFATVLLLVTAQLAFGAKPFHDKFTIDETFEETVCDIDVTTHVVLHINALDFETHFVDLSQGTITFTDADGDWVSNQIAGPAIFSDQLDGDILTITERHVGVHEKLRSSEGLLPAFDRGQISFVTVIDLNDLEDEEDDVVLSFEVLFQAGPHPDADADFALFCDALASVLE
jgi:ethanolamine utilization protein EutP (predicted NTPase)